MIFPKKHTIKKTWCQYIGQDVVDKYTCKYMLFHILILNLLSHLITHTKFKGLGGQLAKYMIHQYTQI